MQSQKKNGAYMCTCDIKSEKIDLINVNELPLSQM
jgi:hypothetical protein